MSQTKNHGYAFQMEMLVRGWMMKKKIEEEPIIFVDRIYGKSKLGASQVFIFLKTTGQLFL